MPNTATFSARIDSNTANNASLNLTGDAAIEITFVAEDAAGNEGDLFLDGYGDGTVDPDTQVEIGGTSYSFSVDFVGNIPTQKNHGSGQVPAEFQGEVVIIIEVEDYPTAGETTRFAFLPDAGATLAEMDAFGNGAININNKDTTPPPTPVCFLAGTAIATPKGDVPIETLRIGDKLVTWDGRIARIICVTTSDHVWGAGPHQHKPIEFKPGALGPGLPETSLIVSPQHKMLVLDHRGRERLAPALGLTHFSGVRQMSGRRRARYIHLMLDRPGLIIAAGAPTESFHPGPTAMQMLDPDQRHEVRLALALIGRAEDDYGPPPRRPMTRRDAEDFATPLTRERTLPGDRINRGNPARRPVPRCTAPGFQALEGDLRRQ